MSSISNLGGRESLEIAAIKQIEIPQKGQEMEIFNKRLSCHFNKVVLFANETIGNCDHCKKISQVHGFCY